ncbi:hypothetical protein D3C84_959320 [compost metagenome]
MQRQYPIELRVAGAEIIDGDSCAGLPVTRHHLCQALDVTAQFSNFENDSLRVYTMLLQLAQARQRLVRTQAADPPWGNIQAEKPVARHLMQTAQRVIAQLTVQATQRNGVCSGIGEQRSH